jgi:competence protein ComGC
MGKRKRLTYIEILLILAIIAILVVWLFPRFLKMLDTNSAEVDTFRMPIVTICIERYCFSSDQVSRLRTSVGKTFREAQTIISKGSIIRTQISPSSGSFFYFHSSS